MRVIILWVVTVIAASSQTSLPRLLEQGLKNIPGMANPVSAAERQEILTATAALLSKHVTFRPDGTASSSFYNLNSRWPMEWRKLVVTRLVPQALTEADRLNGFTLRCHVALACDAFRDWSPKSTGWSQWSPTGFSLFPSAIIVEKKNGALSARGGGADLSKFQPGPGPSIADKPATDATKGLPPGMTRGR